jgi:hypothetical protein
VTEFNPFHQSEHEPADDPRRLARETRTARARVVFAPGTEAHALLDELLTQLERQRTYTAFDELPIVAYREGRKAVLREILETATGEPRA